MEKGYKGLEDKIDKSEIICFCFNRSDGGLVFRNIIIVDIERM